MNIILKFLSYVNIGLFFLPLAVILLSDFSNNTGTSKGVVLLYYFVIYVWLTVPGLLYLLGTRFRKNKAFVFIMFFLNVFFVYILSQQLFAYL
jgi:hypothetical protein